ncbi:MAG: DUF1707 domain-containing protein [Streptosporangiales bacterium]|nr:DUF1707 domain-containing protein [Streptosporangiales bacterium]
MAADRPIRASDDDRERVVAILREQVAAGRLTFEEFDERTGAAYTAKTWDELRNLTSDLPVRVVFADDEQEETRPARRSGLAERPRRPGVLVRPQMLLLPVLVAVVLLGVVRTGAWPVLPFLLIGVFWFSMGSCGRQGRTYSCGPRPTRVTPPRGR